MEVDVEKVRKLRERKVMAIGDLAEKANVGRNTISRIEHGHPARPSTLRKIAAALGVEPEELVKQEVTG